VGRRRTHRQHDQGTVAGALEGTTAEPALALPPPPLASLLKRAPALDGECRVALIRRRLAAKLERTCFTSIR